jgi:hypothetical protein
MEMGCTLFFPEDGKGVQPFEHAPWARCWFSLDLKAQEKNHMLCFHTDAA